MSVIATYRYAVPSYLCDAGHRLKPHAILHFFEDAAWRNAEELGFGHSQLYSRGRMWVLSRVRIEVVRYPLWQEELRLRTWPAGGEKLFALRDFEAHSADGEPCIRAVTQWLLLDSSRARPIPPARVFGNDLFAEIPDGHPCEEAPQRLAPPADALPAEGLSARYSAIDVNGHVNNAEFVRWGYDAVCDDFPAPPEVIEIDFKSAVGNGEALQLQREPASVPSEAGRGDSSLSVALFAPERSEKRGGEAGAADGGAGHAVSVVRFTG